MNITPLPGLRFRVEDSLCTTATSMLRCTHRHNWLQCMLDKPLVLSMTTTLCFTGNQALVGPTTVMLLGNSGTLVSRAASDLAMPRCFKVSCRRPTQSSSDNRAGSHGKVAYALWQGACTAAYNSPCMAHISQIHTRAILCSKHMRPAACDLHT